MFGIFPRNTSVATPLSSVMVPAWATAVVANGGSVSDARVSVVRQFANTLEIGGVLPLIDQLNAWWAENEAQACVCLVSRRVAAPVNGPVHEANKGVTGDSFSSYYNTGFSPATMARAITGGNHHIGAQVLTNVSGTMSVMGVSGGQSTRLRPRGTSDLVGVQISSALGGFVDTVSTSVGYLAAQRAGTTTIKGRKEDAALTDLTISSPSSSLPSGPTFVLARNSSGTPNEFFSGQVGLTYESAPFTTAQWILTRAAILAFGQAVGAIA